MMKPIRIETTSANGNKLNLEALYQIAPSCFTEVLDGSDKHHEGETITVEKDGRRVRMAINFKTLIHSVLANNLSLLKRVLYKLWTAYSILTLSR
ncbi:hypothetical protein [Prevotella corporis]|uniref:hypothetical protein n=1 Tax=Prevotella corporis TaxID=28128 RepID=UPI0023F57C32|nr:hypothetical protein [Prevotella corporis]